jgi:hypothetical protein
MREGYRKKEPGRSEHADGWQQYRERRRQERRR